VETLRSSFAFIASVRALLMSSRSTAFSFPKAVLLTSQQIPTR
jgi:hypothetical protein